MVYLYKNEKYGQIKKQKKKRENERFWRDSNSRPVDSI